MKKVAYNTGDFQFRLSEEAVEWLINRGKTEDWCDKYILHYELRCVPLLIECIETLGYAANEPGLSNLDIREIQGDRYTILFLWRDAEQVITPDEITWYE